MEPNSLKKNTFAQNARHRFLLLFSALGGNGASQEEPKDNSKPHQQINHFSNLKKSPKKLPMVPKIAPNLAYCFALFSRPSWAMGPPELNFEAKQLKILIMFL